MPSPARTGARARFAWLALLLVPAALSAAVRGLWAPDEPRYAQVAREIWEGGGWLVMHLAGEVYPDKPPLVFWLAGAFGALSGWSELAMRIPSLAATLGSAWLCGLLARRFFGEREAVWAAPFYLSFAMVLEIGGRLQLDPVLAFWCLAAIVLASAEGGTRRARSLRLAAAGACVGIAALAKGPVAFANVGLVALAWHWMRRRELEERLPRAGLAAAFVLALLPVCAWALAATLAEPSLADELFYRQHVGRVSRADAHPGPPWKYLVRLPGLLAPWTLLVAAGLARGWRARKLRAAPDGLALSIAWFLALFAFFSILPPKRDLYLLLAYPACALIAARELSLAIEDGRLARWVGLGTPLVLGVVALAGMIGASFFELVPGLGWRAPLALAPLAAGAALAWSHARRERVRAWAGAILGGWMASAALLALFVLSAVDPLKCARAFALEVAARPERPRIIPCLGVQPEAYRFYGGVPAVRDRFDEALASEGAQFLALVRAEMLAELPAETRAKLRTIDSSSVGERTVVLVGAAREDEAEAGTAGG